MGSTNFTEHYDIPLPLGSDKTTPMDYNTSMQAVDTALFTAQGDASDAKQGLATTNQNVAQNTQDISALAGRVTTAEGTISSQGTAITNLGTRVDGVEADAQDMICAYNEASATSSHAYAVGDYFIYNDVLYRATQVIDVGDTIVPDTNCTTTNVTSELKNAGGDLSAYQTKTDNGLNTTSKQIVGAINEVDADVTQISNALSQIVSFRFPDYAHALDTHSTTSSNTFTATEDCFVRGRGNNATQDEDHYIQINGAFKMYVSVIERPLLYLKQGDTVLIHAQSTASMLDVIPLR